MTLPGFLVSDQVFWVVCGLFYLSDNIRPMKARQIVLVKGITVTPTLRIDEKVELSGVFDYSERDYLSSGQLACGIVLAPSDRIGSASLTLLYRPARWLSLTLTGQHQKCTSDTDLGNYTVNIGTLGVRISF